MKRAIKLLTLCLSLMLMAEGIFAASISQEKYKTHLRWNIFVPKEHIAINKKGLTVTINTLNQEIFQKIVKDLNTITPEKEYFSKINVVNPDAVTNNVATVEITLANENVELFSFYRDNENKYVMDFWVEGDSVQTKDSAVKENQEPETKLISEQKTATPPETVSSENGEKKEILENKEESVVAKEGKSVKSVAKVVAKEIKAEKKNIAKEKPFRDFRYGAPFIWNYPALAPQPPQIVDLNNKTPEFFYPIEDREYNKDEKEAHLQLMVNLYRKEKWGLMYKAMKLFAQKYGSLAEVDFIEYLKANAILRENIGKSDPAPTRMAINMFRTMLERTNNYDLAKGLAKYLIAYQLDKKSYVDALEMSKNYYNLTKKNFDIEESTYAAEVILYALASMEQVTKIEEFVQDKTIQKLLPKQSIFAYQGYVYLKANRNDNVVKIYEDNQKSLVEPIHPAILYNTAEAYFRMAEFEKAIKIYDTFLVKYSHVLEASYARVRLALCYEILDKEPEDIINLYKHAVNRTQDPVANYEARVRYVSMASVRKRNPTQEERELRVFLEVSNNETKQFDKDLVKLLWLVRLRTFIVDRKYDDALSYLGAIPVDTLNPTEKNVFDADGAEIVYGLLSENYKKSDFSKIIKIWEVYKDKYFDKVANDPFVNYIVGRAYLKLGLYDGLDRMYSTLQKIISSPTKTYPLWIDREIVLNSTDALLELAIIKNIKLNNIELAVENLKKYEKEVSDGRKINFYKGIMAYCQKKYADSAKYFETYLAENIEKGMHDVDDLAEMFNAYADSLYQTAQLEKFKKVVKAIDSDTSKVNENYPLLNSVKERINDLYIEILSAEKSEESSRVLPEEIGKFLERYPKSIYTGRLKYLLAVNLISQQKDKEGKDILEKLLNDNTVPEYVKGLVKSELSMLKIKDRTL
jgi:hypothetical protein